MLDYPGSVDTTTVGDALVSFGKATLFRCQCGSEEFVKILKHEPRLVYACTNCWKKIKVPRFNFVYEEKVLNE